jgi:hypothetical protein
MHIKNLVLLRDLLLSFTFLLLFSALRGQASGQARLLDHFDERSFVENQGQFDHRIEKDPIRFGFERLGQHIYLSDNKVYFHLFQAKAKEKESESEEHRAEERRAKAEGPEAYTAFERDARRVDFSDDLLEAEWIGANPSAILVPSEMNSYTHTYEIGRYNKMKAIEGVHSYQKVTYKNLYPNIDIEYVLHPQSGIKYSLIVHPGADLSQVKLRYSKKPQLQSDGSIKTVSKFGNVIDHAPVSFLQDSKVEIASRYRVHGNEISFSVGAYNPQQTLVIDPWTNLPNDVNTNWDCAWECEADNLGNVYAIFGAMPLQLRKYNAAGVIQWTYNTTYDTTAWMGTFVTDNAGNSYVTQGSVAAIRKVSPAGALLWSQGNISGMLLGEFWNIAFNCDQSRLIVGGTGGVLAPLPYIFGVNPTTGALAGSIQVHAGTGLFSPSEVRGITATTNGKYYWLSHDSIGYINQNFTACPGSGSVLVANNNYDLGYKCDNWRYDNTGIEAMAYFGGFVFVNRGDRIDKRLFATGAIVASAAIPGGGFTTGFGGAQVQNSGIIIDNTGRIFVGSRGSVSQFNTNLALIATTPVTGAFNVYDVALTSTGQLIACGASGTSATASRVGTVEALSVVAAAPFVMTCCDATICPIGPFCSTNGAVTLTASAGGAVWSSSAPGFVPATGTFNPSVAGVGNYTFYNTQGCGVDSLVIQVIPCAGLTVCRLPNGDLQATGGVAPYQWQTGTMVSSCPFGLGPGCAAFTQTLNTLTWTNYTTGGLITPPPGADTMRVTASAITNTSWNIATLPPCSVLPIALSSFAGEGKAPMVNALEWETSSEDNSLYFTLERSLDTRDWKFVDQIPAAGNSLQPSHYDYLDKAAYSPLTWYRLGLTDNNGYYNYLSTIAVVSEGSDNLVMDVHPNPADAELSFTYLGDKHATAPLQLSIVNALGQLVTEQSWTGLTQQQVLSVDVSSLSAGMYLLGFQQGPRSSFRKVVVMRD